MEETGHERWVSQSEAAEIIGVSARTLYNWRCEGKGPKYAQVGERMYRYYTRDLHAFMKSNIENGESEDE